jgi:hypothetical protein
MRLALVSSVGPVLQPVGELEPAKPLPAEGQAPRQETGSAPSEPV